MNYKLKKEGRVIIDFPNKKHPLLNIMIKYESYLGRTKDDIPSGKEFDSAVKEYFLVENIDDSKLMLKYFLRNNK